MSDGQYTLDDLDYESLGEEPMRTIQREALRFGLRVTSTRRSPARNRAVGGAKNSFHLSGQAADVSGDPNKMAEFYRHMRATYGPDLAELFYDSEGGYKRGSDIGAIGKHSDHVHVAYKPDGRRGRPQGKFSTDDLDPIDRALVGTAFDTATSDRQQKPTASLDEAMRNLFGPPRPDPRSVHTSAPSDPYSAAVDEVAQATGMGEEFARAFLASKHGQRKYPGLMIPARSEPTVSTAPRDLFESAMTGAPVQAPVTMPSVGRRVASRDYPPRAGVLSHSAQAEPVREEETISAGGFPDQIGPEVEGELYGAWYAAHKEGNVEDAGRLAQTYLSAFPKGQYAEAIRNQFRRGAPAADPRETVTIDLGEYVRQGDAPTADEVAKRIYNALGFTDTEAEKYAQRVGAKNVTEAFYGFRGGAGDAQAAMRSILERAKADPGGRVAIPGLDRLAVERTREQLSEIRKEREGEQRGYWLEYLKNLPEKSKERTARQITRSRPLDEDERKALGAEYSLWDTFSGAATRSVGELVSGVGQMLPSGPAGIYTGAGNPAVTRAGDMMQREGQAAVNLGKRPDVWGSLVEGTSAMAPDLAASFFLPEAKLAHLGYWMATAGLKSRGRGDELPDTLKEMAMAGLMLEANKPLAPVMNRIGEGLFERGIKGTTRVMASAALGYGMAKAEGATDDEAISSAIQFGAQNVFGGKRAEEGPDRVTPKTTQERRGAYDQNAIPEARRAEGETGSQAVEAAPVGKEKVASRSQAKRRRFASEVRRSVDASRQKSGASDAANATRNEEKDARRDPETAAAVESLRRIEERIKQHDPRDVDGLIALEFGRQRILERPGVREALGLGEAPPRREVAPSAVEGVKPSRPDTQEMIASANEERRAAKREPELTTAPRYAYRVRDVGERGLKVTPESHAQASMSESDVRRVAPSRSEGAQEVVRADLSKLDPKDYEVIERGDGQQPWVKFKRDLDESAFERVSDITDADRAAASKADPEMVEQIKETPLREIAEETGLSPKEAEKGRNDVIADGMREFSPEAVAVKRAAIEQKPERGTSAEEGVTAIKAKLDEARQKLEDLQSRKHAGEPITSDQLNKQLREIGRLTKQLRAAEIAERKIANLRRALGEEKAEEYQASKDRFDAEMGGGLEILPDRGVVPRIEKPRTLAEVVTPKQLVAIRSISNDKRVGQDEVSQRLFGRRADELSKPEASQLIDHLKKMERQTVRPVQEEAKQSSPAVEGKSSKAITERGTEIETRFKVVEADDLISSHDTGLKPDSRYPAEVQPRDRTRGSSEEQIERMARTLRPELLGESAKASDGAPIVGSDSVVESGNGRVIALKRVYEGNTEKAAEYRKFVMENAEQFGLDPERVGQMKNPVLVRERTTPVDRAQFAREANETSVAEMSPVERARTDSEKLTPEMMAEFYPNDAGEILTAANRPFIAKFLEQVIGPSERARYVQADGSVSQEGVNRIRNAVFARAYADTAEGISALEKLAESTDVNVRNIVTAMLHQAGRMASLKAAIRQGSRYDLDISGDVATAMKKLSSLREQGTIVDDYLRQMGLFGEDLTPLQKQILSAFDSNKRSAKQIDRILDNYLRGVETAGDPRQRSFFGSITPTKEMAFESAVKEAASGKGEQAELLFGGLRPEGKGTQTRSGDIQKTNPPVEGERPPASESAGPALQDVSQRSKAARERLKKRLADETDPDTVREPAIDEDTRTGNRQPTSTEVESSYAKRPDASPEATALAEDALRDLHRVRVTFSRRGDERPEGMGRGLSVRGRTHQSAEESSRTGAGESDFAVRESDRPDSGREGNPRLVGLAITTPLKREGRVDLRGMLARSHEDVAQLGQMLRDPRIETFRVFYTKGDQIVAQEAISSRMPDSAASFVMDKFNARVLEKLNEQLEAATGRQKQEIERRIKDVRRKAFARHTFRMQARMKRLGADGYYFVHNHPSGRPVPGREDIRLTGMFENAVAGFRGHVVINSGEFGLIEPGGGPARIEKLDTPPERLLKASIPHDLLNLPVDRQSLPILAKKLQNPTGWVTLVYRDSGGRVRAVEEVPSAKFRQIADMTDYIRARKRDFGARDAFAVASEGAKVQDAGVQLMRNGLLYDHVTLGKSAYEAGIDPGIDTKKSKPFRVEDAVDNDLVESALEYAREGKEGAWRAALQNELGLGFERVKPRLTSAWREAERLIGEMGSARPAGEMKTQELFESKPEQPRSSKLETLLTLRKAGLLSGLKTHARNIVGTASYQAFDEAARVPAALMDMAISAVTKRRTITGPNAAAVAKSGYEAATKGVKEAVEILRKGATAEDLKKMEVQQELNSGSRVIDFYVNTMFRLLGAEDRIFRTYALRRALLDRARSQALTEWREGKIARSEVSVRTKEIVAKPDEDIAAAALLDAETATFNNENVISTFVQRGREGIKEIHGAKAIETVIDLSVPFIRTPTNIIARLLEATPLGFGKNVYQIGKAVAKKMFTEADQRAFAQTFGRASVGSGLIWLGWKMAAAGLATGIPDDEPLKRERDKAAGRSPMSIRLSKDGDWHSVAGFSPLGNLIAIGASLYRENTRSLKDEAKRPEKLAAVFGKTILDQPLLKGAKDITDALSQPGSAKEKTGRVVGSFMPTIVSDVADIADSKEREAKGFAQQLQKRVPGWRNSLPEKTDVFGRPVEQRSSSFIDPTLTQTARERFDEVDREMVRVDAGIGELKKKPGESDEAFRARARETGQKVYNGLALLFKSSDYKKAGDEEKRALIIERISSIRTKETKSANDKKPKKKAASIF